ncbi:MAG: Predicted amidohydrolase SSO1643 [uncultured Rubrobacteraceae bacterium]|uniref:Predicted amidohydrolase SSO1643 n=1 Tax=uncultured Rubrobacteraceae bacterium TaxID=349277 RepID=A0A6J4RQ71_9ACTN|nr:MAG: Predicted amidohydrolase SSO1643 [uncultured Rubrobacteraceae bacterium]
MYEKDGEKYFVVDEHVHYWDASPENTTNKYGEGFIKCFYDYHKNLSPEEYVWSFEKYRKYSEEDMMHDLFEVGHVDKAIFQSTYLSDFYDTGFNTAERNSILAEKHPGKFIVNGSFDPRYEQKGLEEFERQVREHGWKGVKLYTAEWRGDSRGWNLDDEWSLKHLEKCVELGVKNVHVHKGPTIWPLNKDSFDVADVDRVAGDFPDLNFVVEHVGLPRLEDFCWIGTQEPNVYGGLAVAMPFIHAKPRYFAQIIGELLYWLGEDRILFASDYALWQPKWLVEMFVDFEYPGDPEFDDYAEITPDIKRKILGLNAAKLYDIEVPEELQLVTVGEDTGFDVTEKPATDE